MTERTRVTDMLLCPLCGQPGCAYHDAPCSLCGASAEDVHEANTAWFAHEDWS